jgi:nicotinamidase-related amidase
MPTALLLVDIQNDYFPGGRMELEGSLAASANAGRVLAAFRNQARPVIHIQHLAAQADAGFFIPGTAGAEIHVEVAPLAGETVVHKHFPNAFRATALLEQLRGSAIDHLVIGGMMTHMCIDATTRAACDHGFQCTLLHDACATRALSFGALTVPAAQVQAAFLAALGAAYARLVGCDAFLATLA